MILTPVIVVWVLIRLALIKNMAELAITESETVAVCLGLGFWEAVLDAQPCHSRADGSRT
jgi:hypothetical protein